MRSLGHFNDPAIATYCPIPALAFPTWAIRRAGQISIDGDLDRVASLVVFSIPSITYPAIAFWGV
jgi:hypothetical protein